MQLFTEFYRLIPKFTAYFADIYALLLIYTEIYGLFSMPTGTAVLTQQ